MPGGLQCHTQFDGLIPPEKLRRADDRIMLLPLGAIVHRIFTARQRLVERYDDLPRPWINVMRVIREGRPTGDMNILLVEISLHLSHSWREASKELRCDRHETVKSGISTPLRCVLMHEIVEFIHP